MERVNSAQVASNKEQTAPAPAAAAPAPEPAPQNQMAQAATPPPPSEQTEQTTTSNTQTATKTITDMPEGNQQNLPQTGSELPLLALLGVGSLGTGLLAKWKK